MLPFPFVIIEEGLYGGNSLSVRMLQDPLSSPRYCREGSCDLRIFSFSEELSPSSCNSQMKNLLTFAEDGKPPFS